MIWLAWRTLRWHPGSLMGTLVTLVLAATAVGAMWFVVDADSRQTVTVERYAGVPLVVGTRGAAIPPELVAAVRALPEVAQAIPEVTFPAGLYAGGARVSGPGDQNPWPWGHGWSSARLTPFHLSEGRAPRAAGEVVVDTRLAASARVAVGSRVEIAVSGTVRPHRVVGLARPGAAWRFQSALFFADDQVRPLTGRGAAADALGVYPGPGVGIEALRAAVTRVAEPYNSPRMWTVRVVAGAGRGALESNLPAGYGVNTLWFLVGMTALVATGMIATTMGLSVRRRGMEIAVLRAVGARPGQVRRMLLAEAVLLAVVAVAAAVPLAMLFAPVVAAWLRATRALSVAYEQSYQPLPVLWTFVLTLGIALAASLTAVRRAVRIRPGDALGEAPAEGRALGRGRLMTGLALLAGAGAAAAFLAWEVAELPDQAELALRFATICTLVAGVGLVAPWVVLVAGRLVRAAVTRVSPVGGYLAVAGVVFHHRRFAGAAGSLTLGVALVGVVAGVQSFYDWRLAARTVAEVRADHVVRPAEAYGALSEDLRRSILERGASDAVGTGSLPAVLSVEGRPPVIATVVTGEAARVFALSVRGRPIGGLGAGEIAITDELAGAHRLGLGSRVGVRAVGTAEESAYTVASIFSGSQELGSVLMSPGGAPASGLHERIYVRGAAPGRVADPRAAVETLSRQEYTLSKSTKSAEANRTLTYMAVMIALLCLVAAVNNLCLGLLDRRREFSGLRHLGLRRGQVMRIVSWESALTVVPVLVLALVATAAMALVHAAGEPGGLGSVLVFVPAGWLVPLAAGALVSAWAGSLLVVRGIIRKGVQ
ncbi:FtsX-like permease family protein [Nonomuraea typhae]|uniref:FtsX-like permease family protein n=1 Tax=Nonomuraea typhae TaxID=2603600 RepID=A0ABW7Z1J5_9ACTN